MRIRCRNLRNQLILVLGKRQAVEVHPLALPLVGEDDGHVGVLRQGRGGRRVRSGVKLHICCRCLGANRLQRRSRKPNMCLPVRIALARRHDRVSARGVNLRRTAAGNHAHIGVRPDHRDAVNLRSVERKLRMIVLQQHRTFFSDFLRDFQAAHDVHHAPLRRIVNHTSGEHAPQNAAHMIVQFRYRHLARFDCLLELVTVEDFARLLMIESGSRGLLDAVCTAPVRQYKALEVPVFLHNVGQQILVFAGVVAPDPVVGAHHRRRIGFLQSDFKRQQIALARGAFVDGYVDRVASAILIIERVMFDVADDMLRLQPLHDRPHHLSGKHRILAQIFKRPSVARFAGKVSSAAERHVVTLRPQLAANQCSVFESCIEIPARRSRQVRGQRGRVAAILAAAPDAVSRVRHLNRGNAQARNARYVARAAVRVYG